MLSISMVVFDYACPLSRNAYDLQKLMVETAELLRIKLNVNILKHIQSYKLIKK